MLQFSYENTMTQVFLEFSEGKHIIMHVCVFMASFLVESTCVVTLRVDLCVFSLVPRAIPRFYLVFEINL